MGVYILYIDLYMEVYILNYFWLLIRAIRLAIFESKSSARSAILSEVRASCCPSCDWLQQSHTLHKIGPVLPFPHASPVATQQPSNSVWCGFELTHRDNSTKSVSTCWCVACGCGCHVCLQRPLWCTTKTVTVAFPQTNLLSTAML